MNERKTVRNGLARLRLARGQEQSISSIENITDESFKRRRKVGDRGLSVTYHTTRYIIDDSVKRVREVQLTSLILRNIW
jgi:hypothetical protein